MSVKGARPPSSLPEGAPHRAALELRRAADKPRPLAIATSQNNLANTLVEQGRFDEALALHQEVLAERLERLGPDHPARVPTLVHLGDLLEAQGQRAQARARYQQAREILERAAGPEHPERAKVDAWLGEHGVR